MAAVRPGQARGSSPPCRTGCAEGRVEATAPGGRPPPGTAALPHSVSPAHPAHSAATT